MYKSLLNILIILLILIGCVEPYEFEIVEGDSRMVVEGRITNKPGPYEVILTKSANYTTDVSGISKYISGALVYIIDDQENFELLEEKYSGHYYTSESGIQGVIGHSYYLEIIMGTDIYRSEPEVILDSPPIDRLFYEYEPGSTLKEQGFYVYLDTNDPSDKLNFYKWESTSWWLYSWDCWNRVRDFDPFNIQSDENVNGNKIARQLIKIAPYNSTLPYIVTVEQLSLSAQAYNYLKNVNKQIESSGTMFDPPPTFLRGNIEKVNNPDYLVLGYFYAAGISELEIAVDRTGLETQPVDPIYPKPDPLYCGDPCNYLCVAMSGGICGVKPCPPECNDLPEVTYIPPESWPLPHKRCDE
jgi:hypothetical protein